MRYLLSIPLFLIAFLFSYNSAQAIIVIPALILIPIVKVVAIIIGALSVPTLGISAAIAKIHKKSVYKSLFIGVGILVLVALILIVLLRLVIPNSTFL